MNEHEFDKELYTAAAETLEGLALMFLLDADEATPSPVVDGTLVRVGFTGPFDGALYVIASDGLTDELAGNMLGVADDEPDADQRADAIKELSNVVCGNLLPAVGGRRAVFHVAAPELLDGGPLPDTADGLRPAGWVNVQSDSGAVELKLFVDEEAFAATEA